MRRLFVVMALLLLPAGAVLAQNAGQNSAGQMPAALQPPPPFLGRDLLALCQAADGSAERRGCLRYLQGAVAMYEALLSEGKEVSWFCPPREAPATMLRQQFVEYGEQNADDMAQDAIKAVRFAMTDAFPCQE